MATSIQERASKEVAELVGYRRIDRVEQLIGNTFCSLEKVTLPDELWNRHWIQCQEWIYGLKETSSHIIRCRAITPFVKGG